MAEAEQDKAPVAGNEISVAYGERDITRGYVNANGTLWNEDAILTLRLGGDLSVYTDLLRDDQVGSAWDQRTSALVGAGWSVQPASESALDKAAADFVTEQLRAIQWDAVCEKMLFARFYGFSVAELVWQVTPEGRLGWKCIKVRNRERFLFTASGRCYLRTMKDSGGAIEPGNRIWCDAPNFWTLTAGADHSDNPYGVGLAHRLYWPVRFKRDAMRFWIVYLEKFAMPTAVGKFKSGSTAADKSSLLTAIMAVQTQAGVTIPESMAIELLEAKRTGSSDYSPMIAKIDAAVQKIIVGQTLTSEVGSAGGNRALGEVHMGVRQDIVKSDADLLNESFSRGPVAWLVRANFPGAGIPTVQREIEAPRDLSPLAEQLSKLKTIGFKPSLELVQEQWGADMQETETPPALVPGAFPPAGPGAKPREDDPEFSAFAAGVRSIFADQDALDGALTDFEPRMERLSAKLIDPVLDYAGRHSPAEVFDALREALPDYRGEKLEEALARVLFVSMTWGRANADA